MRRRDRQVTSMAWIEEVLQSAGWLTIGVCGRNAFPHLAFMPFIYKNGSILTGGAEEETAALLDAESKVCFQVVTHAEVIRHDSLPSKFSMKYKSVTGFGEARLVTAEGDGAPKIEIIVKGVTGKSNGYQPPA